MQIVINNPVTTGVTQQVVRIKDFQPQLQPIAAKQFIYSELTKDPNVSTAGDLNRTTTVYNTIQVFNIAPYMDSIINKDMNGLFLMCLELGNIFSSMGIIIDTNSLLLSFTR